MNAKFDEKKIEKFNFDLFGGKTSLSLNFRFETTSCKIFNRFGAT